MRRHRRGASSLSSTGSTSTWRRARAWVLNRDGQVCQFPGRQRPAPTSWAAVYRRDWPGVCGSYADTVDHVVKREDGGTDAPANLRAACGRHNYGRGNRTDEQLLAELASPQLTPRTIPTLPRPGRRWTW